jgi:hypothetical protein
MRRVETVAASPRSTASSMMALAANRAPERSSRSSCPLACNSSIRPSVAITCRREGAAVIGDLSPMLAGCVG